MRVLFLSFKRTAYKMKFDWLYRCKPVHPKGDQSWVFTGRTDAETETPILWPPHVKSWLIGKDPDSGRDWGQEEKGMTEDEMAGWHHQLDGHEFEWTPGDGDGEKGLVCCNSWGHKESDTTEQLNWTDRCKLDYYTLFCFWFSHFTCVTFCSSLVLILCSFSIFILFAFIF